MRPTFRPWLLKIMVWWRLHFSVNKNGSCFFRYCALPEIYFGRSLLKAFKIRKEVNLSFCLAVKDSVALENLPMAERV